MIAETVDVSEYLHLAEFVSRKFYKGKERIRDTDVFSIACQYLVRCSQKYNSSLGNFENYAIRFMRNGIIQHIRSLKCKKRLAEFDSLSDQQWQAVPEKESLPLEIIEGLIRDLSVEDQQLVKDIYFENQQATEVSDRLGISRVTLYKRLKKIFLKLREKYENVSKG